MFLINRNTNNIIETIGSIEGYEIATEQEISDFLLQEAKDSKIAQIKANKTAFIYQPIDYNGSTFSNSEISSNALNIMIDKTSEPIEWLDIEGAQIDLTSVQAAELLTLIIHHRKSTYFQEVAIIKAITHSTTIEEIESVTITFS